MIFEAHTVDQFVTCVSSSCASLCLCVRTFTNICLSAQWGNQYTAVHTSNYINTRNHFVQMINILAYCEKQVYSLPGKVKH